MTELFSKEMVIMLGADEKIVDKVSQILQRKQGTPESVQELKRKVVCI